jgi:hypothetical protein
MDYSYLILAYVGLLLHYLFRWKECVDENKQVNYKAEMPSFIISIIVTGIMIYLGEDIKDIYPLTPATALLLGYGNQSIFNKLVKSKNL